MAINIFCRKQDGPEQVIEMAAGKQVRIRIKSKGAGDGSLSLSASSAGCSYRYEGQAVSELNGAQSNEGVLVAGDALVVGKMRFRIEPAGGGSEETVPYRRPGIPTPVTEAAEGIDEAILDEDRPVDSQDLAPHVARHQRTAELPDAALVMSHEDGDAGEQEETVDMPGRREAGIEAVPADEETAHFVPESGDAQEGRARERRRISASQDSVVGQGGSRSNRSLLDKMARMFRRNDQRAVRLRELLEDRDDLYQEAGRSALTPDCGIGLPPTAVQSWLRGEKVALAGDDLDRIRLEEYVKVYKLLNDLNAEIHALRREMGMDDVSERMPSDTVLRTESREAEERAFCASDVVYTEDLDSLAGSQIETEPVLRKPSAGDRSESPVADGADAPEAPVTPSENDESGAEASSAGDDGEAKAGQAAHRRRGHRRRRRR